MSDKPEFVEITFWVSDEIRDFLVEMATESGQSVDQYMRQNMEYARGAYGLRKAIKKAETEATPFGLKPENRSYL